MSRTNEVNFTPKNLEKARDTWYYEFTITSRVDTKVASPAYFTVWSSTGTRFLGISMESIVSSEITVELTEILSNLVLGDFVKGEYSL
jgi:hypothetical protein